MMRSGSGRTLAHRVAGLAPPVRNLDHRPERWEFMQRQFQRLRMPVERTLSCEMQCRGNGWVLGFMGLGFGNYGFTC